MVAKYLQFEISGKTGFRESTRKVDNEINFVMKALRKPTSDYSCACAFHFFRPHAQDSVLFESDELVRAPR